MNLFETGEFKLSSGIESDWKIECDALMSRDWDTLALIVSKAYKFNRVVGIPEGGLPFAAALEPYAMNQPDRHGTLLVDDVVTTGKSFEKYRDKLYVDGRSVVMCLAAFSRTEQKMFGKFYSDTFEIHSLFQINPAFLP